MNMNTYLGARRMLRHDLAVRVVHRVRVVDARVAARAATPGSEPCKMRTDARDSQVAAPLREVLGEVDLADALLEEHVRAAKK